MSASSAPTDPPKVAGERPRKSSVALVLTSIFILSTLLGVYAYARYRQSEKYIRKALIEFEQRGRESNVEQCVDQALSWSRRCTAIVGLCDASISRMVNACLGGGDRTEYCRSIAHLPKTTDFGFPQCRRRGLKGRRKKACAAAYRMIAAHCASRVATSP